MTLYVAEGCGLCTEALEVLRAVQAEVGSSFSLDVVGIDGDEQLEARYRVLLPVVEIDGEQALAYHVDATSLRKRLS